MLFMADWMLCAMSRNVCVSQFDRPCKPSQSDSVDDVCHAPAAAPAGFIAGSDRCIHQLLYTPRINGLLPLAVDLLDNDTVARDRGKPFAIVLAALPLPLPLPPNPRRKDARLWKLTLHSLVCVVLC